MRIVIIQRDSEAPITYTYYIDNPDTMKILSELVRTIQNLSSTSKVTPETENSEEREKAEISADSVGGNHA